mgnify:FL=1
MNIAERKKLASYGLKIKFPCRRMHSHNLMLMQDIKFQHSSMMRTPELKQDLKFHLNHTKSSKVIDKWKEMTSNSI